MSQTITTYQYDVADFTSGGGSLPRYDPALRLEVEKALADASAGITVSSVTTGGSVCQIVVEGEDPSAADKAIVTAAVAAHDCAASITFLSWELPEDKVDPARNTTSTTEVELATFSSAPLEGGAYYVVPSADHHVLTAAVGAQSTARMLMTVGYGAEQQLAQGTKSVDEADGMGKGFQFSVQDGERLHFRLVHRAKGGATSRIQSATLSVSTV